MPALQNVDEEEEFFEGAGGRVELEPVRSTAARPKEQEKKQEKKPKRKKNQTSAQVRVLPAGRIVRRHALMLTASWCCRRVLSSQRSCTTSVP